MAAKTPSVIKVETEGDLQIVNCKILAVQNGDTLDLSGYFKNIVMLLVNGLGNPAATDSAGVITFNVTSGSNTLYLRAAGN